MDTFILTVCNSIAQKAKSEGMPWNWTRKEMYDYLEIEESDLPNDELWELVVAHKELKLKQMWMDKGLD